MKYALHLPEQDFNGVNEAEFVPEKLAFGSQGPNLPHNVLITLSDSTLPHSSQWVNEICIDDGVHPP